MTLSQLKWLFRPFSPQKYLDALAKLSPEEQRAYVVAQLTLLAEKAQKGPPGK